MVQPTWKNMLVKLDHFANFRGENIIWNHQLLGGTLSHEMWEGASHQLSEDTHDSIPGLWTRCRFCVHGNCVQITISMGQTPTPLILLKKMIPFRWEKNLLTWDSSQATEHPHKKELYIKGDDFWWSSMITPKQKRGHASSYLGCPDLSL